MPIYGSDGQRRSAWLNSTSGLIPVGLPGDEVAPGGDPGGTIPATDGSLSPTMTLDRPVLAGGSLTLNLPTAPANASYAWSVVSGGGSLSSATATQPVYTAPSGLGVATIQVQVGGTTSTMKIAYGPNIIRAENQFSGPLRDSPTETWDLVFPNIGGHPTLLGFADGYTFDRTQRATFKIAQSDGAGWSAQIYRLGWYGATAGARLYDTLTPTSAQLSASWSQPGPLDADPDTVKLSADCSNWATTLTWDPPSWAPSGVYILRLNRTGGGASHVMFILRDDARTADLMFMTADSTWHAYNAFGGMDADQYSGNSLYHGTPVLQNDDDCARFVSYDRPIVNRGAADPGRSYGAVKFSNFFHAEYVWVRFLERNGYDVKYYGCIDAAGDQNGTKLDSVKAGIFAGHNEYWSDGMRAGWEAAKLRGLSVFSSAGNEVFWRMVGDRTGSAGRPRRFECQKSTINGRGSTRPQWTGTWRDPDGAGKGGGYPENLFTGTIFTVNGPNHHAMTVPVTGGYSASPLWRDSSVAALVSGMWTSPSEIVGFEWDTYGPAGVSTSAAQFMAQPHAQARYASSTSAGVSAGMLLTDAGDVYSTSGTAEHRLVIQPSGTNGGITFGCGTVNWGLGLDNANLYQSTGGDNTANEIRQATVNMLCDMGAMPTSLMSPLVTPTRVVWF